MSDRPFTPVNNIIVKVKPRAWTHYTIVDYINALGKDFELAMKIREELYPGINEACPVKRLEEKE